MTVPLFFFINDVRSGPFVGNTSHPILLIGNTAGVLLHSHLLYI